MIEKDYDYNPEPGNDFTYDDHGNVFYGRGFVGAPRLPSRSLGLDARDFVDKYIKINEEIRLNFLNEDNDELSYELNLIKFILQDYEKDKDKESLIKRLDKVARKYIPHRSYSYQLKYFLEIYQILNVRKESKLIKNLPTLELFLESNITRQSIQDYKEIYNKDQEEKAVEYNYKYIMNSILSHELSLQNTNKPRTIQIFLKHLKFPQNKQQILEKIIQRLKEKFVDFDITLDPKETYIYIDWN
jgi:hypothetical protein